MSTYEVRAPAVVWVEDGVFVTECEACDWREFSTDPYLLAPLGRNHVAREHKTERASA